MAKNFYAKEVYLLSGLIECGECGSKMNGNISYYNKNGEKLRYVMYRCTGKGTSAKDYIKSIPRDIVEEYILSEMEKTIFSKDAVNHLVKELSKYSDVKQKQMKDELNFNKNRMAKINEEIKNIVEVIAMGKSYSSLLERLSNLEKEKEELEILIEETKLKYPNEEPITENYLRSIFKEHKRLLENRDKQLIKKFISLYVEKVSVFKDYIYVVFKLSEVLVQRSYGELYHK